MKGNREIRRSPKADLRNYYTVFWNFRNILVIPLVHVVAAFSVVIAAAVRLVKVTSDPPIFTTPVSPTAASSQVTVMPLSASRNLGAGGGGAENVNACG
jgi:hypothetical protein